MFCICIEDRANINISCPIGFSLADLILIVGRYPYNKVWSNDPCLFARQRLFGNLYIEGRAGHSLARNYKQYDGEDKVKFSIPLKTFGDKVIMFSAVGRASAAKLALNQLIASLTTAFSMSLGYLREKQVDIDKFMEILRDSALYAAAFDKKFTRMIQRDFSNPNFPVKHLLKDVDLMLRDFGDAGINIAALEGVKKILLKAMENGDADMDYSALYNAINPK